MKNDIISIGIISYYPAVSGHHPRFTNSAAYAIINIGENHGKILFNKTLRAQHWFKCRI